MTAPALRRYADGSSATPVLGDNLNTFTQGCNTAAQLRAFTGTVGMKVLLGGISAINDGGQGFFYWSTTSTGPDDNLDIIQPTGLTTGAWVRLTQEASLSFSSPPPIGNVTPNTGDFTTLTADTATFTALNATTATLGTITTVNTTGRIIQNYSQALGTGSALTQAITSNLSISGSINNGQAFVNSINMADGANTTGTGGPGALNFFYVLDLLSATATGGRIANLNQVILNATTADGVNGNFYIGTAGNAYSNANQGGTISVGSGILTGGTFEAAAKNGATFMLVSEAMEVGAGCYPNGSAYASQGLQISPLGFDGSHGGFGQYSGLIYNHGVSGGPLGDGEGLLAGVTFGSQVGNLFPIQTGGSLVNVAVPTLSPSTTVALGVDLALGGFNIAAFRSPSFSVDGSGNVGGATTSGVTLQTRDGVTSKTAVVATVVVRYGGYFRGTTFPTLTLSAPPGSGTTATATVTTVGVGRLFGIAAGGTGHAVNDVITLVGGTFATAAQFTVTTVSSGVVTGLKLTTVGSYTVLPAGPISTTSSGAGSGLTLYALWAILTCTVTGAGTNYPEWPRPTIVGSLGGGNLLRLPNLDVTMTATQGTLTLNSGGTSQTTTLVTTGNATVQGYSLASTADNITAFAGGGQAKATQLAKQFNRLTTVATAGDSVKLPVSIAGMAISVHNDGAKSAQVFGASPDTINNLPTATGVTLATTVTATYRCYTAGAWHAS